MLLNLFLYTFHRGLRVLRQHNKLNVESLLQRGLLIENLPPALLRSNDGLVNLFGDIGIRVLPDEVHIMRNRFGIPTGKAMVLTERVSEPNTDFNFKACSEPTDDGSGNVNLNSKSIQNLIIDHLPHDTRLYSCDEHEVKCFVEQCERFLKLSEDLRKLALPQHFNRIVTIRGVPRSYGRNELANVVKTHTNVDVLPGNIIFRFKSGGDQDGVAWLICNDERDVLRIISKLQEIAVPRRYQYGSLMGAAFLYASRSSLFISDPSIDFITKKTKYQVFTTGWCNDVDEDELTYLSNSLKFYPKSVKVHKVKAPGVDETCAFIECDRMRNTKKLMMRLQLLKKRWKIPENSPFYAYPKTADVHWESQNGSYDDVDPTCDSDLDEPIEY